MKKLQDSLEALWSSPYINEVIFTIDNSNKFVACLYEQVQDLSFGSTGRILWLSLAKQPIEVVGPAIDNMFHSLVDLYKHLRDLLQGKLEYQGTPLSGDLGYNLNLIYAQDPRANREDSDLIHSFKLWDSYTDIHVWLYSHQGNFYLEITPFLAWIREENEADDDSEFGEEETPEEKARLLEAFRKRMINYKPLATFTLPRETVERWFEQAKELTAIIYKNFENEEGGFHVDIETEL